MSTPGVSDGAIDTGLRYKTPAAVFLAKRREGLEIDNPKADDFVQDIRLHQSLIETPNP